MNIPLRILLVNDDAAERASILGQLNRSFSSLSVKEASGTELAEALGVEASHDCPYDLVILDSELHGTDGLAGLRACKLRWPDLPVVMLISLAREEIAEEALLAEVDDYVLKSPHYVARLPAAVRSAIQRASQRRALRESEERHRTLAKAAHESLVPVRDAAGQVAAVMGISRDITARKQASESLQEKVKTLETLAEIDHEITAAAEPQKVLDLVCRRAAELVQAPKSLITIQPFSGQREMMAHYGWLDPERASQDWADQWQLGAPSRDSLGLPQVVAVHDAPANILPAAEFHARENIHAFVRVPLIVGDQVIGGLMVYDTAPRAWSEDEIQILSLLGGQASIGLEQARLYQAARNQATHLAILNAIGQSLTSTLDLDCVLTSLLESVRVAAGAEACSVALVERDTGDLVFLQAVGAGAQSVVGQRLRPGAGIAGWVIEHRQSALVSDAPADPRFYRAMDRSTGVPTRDVACVPLIAHDAVIGVIELVNKQSGQFDADDLRLLESVAAQAAVAIENAQLYQAQRQQAKDLDAMNAIFRSLATGLELEALVHAIARSLRRLFDFDRASLALVDPDRQTFTMVALQDSGQVLLAQGMTLGFRDTAAAEDIKQGRTHVTDNLATESDFVGERLLYQSGLRSRINVPLVHAGRVIGSLNVASTRLAAFGPREIALLEQISGPLAIAIENARLFASLSHEKDRLELLYRLAQQLAQSLDVREVAQRALDGIRSVIGAIEGIVLMLDPATGEGHLRPVAASGYTAESLDALDRRLQMRIGRGLAGWVAQQRHSALVDDLMTDSRWFTVPGVDDWARSALSVPLVSGDELVGVFSVYSNQKAYFNFDHRRLVESAAASVAVSMANARLYQAERDQYRRLQQSQVQLIQAEKMSALGRLVASVTHEINNPLQALQGSLELATEEVESDLRRDRLARQVGIAHREVERIANIVRRLRDFYRPARQEMRPVDIHAVLNTMLELAGKQLQHSDVTVEREWASDLPPVYANPDHLAQVFLNLTINAIDAMSGRGGTLRIRTALTQIEQPDVAPRPAVRVEFFDTGGGIAPENLPRVFEPFFTTKVSGTGLGLSICYGIVEAHNGQIAVSSELGVGTTFTILLPLGEASESNVTHTPSN